MAAGFPAPALANTDPIKIGYLPALTGPSSSTGIGINRGTQLAVDQINKAGGISGRKVELIVRDTQSDPTKAVNAVAELTQREKCAIIWGPLNSGEALAATPLIARNKVPMLHPCWVDELIDVKKYPMSFRMAPTNTQVGKGANHYVVNVLKLKKVAVISDTTGYGTASVNTYVPMLKAMGAEVVYSNHVDAANPDLKPELLRMQSGGAQAIMPWSVNAGFLSRILNTRGVMGWDVPVVGQTTLGSGQTKALLEKPENWNKVYSNNFRNCCYKDGKLPPKAAEFVERLKKEKIEFGDTLLWWVALGWDGAALIGETLKAAGPKSDAIVGHWNKLKSWPGIYGTVTWTPQEHNGFPDEEVVMAEVNSLKDGAFNIAPGYSG
jgi:branched-chain amino acid transport system substrate-binding protein